LSIVEVPSQNPASSSMSGLTADKRKINQEW